MERDERRNWAAMEDADEPERGDKPRCKRRYRLPGTTSSDDERQARRLGVS